jgi:hypothetical protein
MARPQITLMVGSFGVAAVGFSSVGARGGPSPHLKIELSARAMSPNFRINVVQFQADVQVVHGEALAVVQAVELGEPIASGENSLVLEGPLTREALRFMESQFRVQRKCALTMDLRSLLWFKDDAPGGQSGTTAFVQPGQWGLLPTTKTMLVATVTRDDWLENVVKVIQPDDRVILEVPIPTTTNRARFEKALKHLATAQEQYQQGNDAAVLQACYGAFESLSPGAQKAVLAKLTDVEKREHLDELLKTAKTYLHAGRHVSTTGAKEGEYDVDHRDAEFALGVTKMAVSYVARLLTE